MIKAASIDIGSTWTKAALFALDGPRSSVLAMRAVPTTQDDLARGFRGVLADVLSAVTPATGSGHIGTASRTSIPSDIRVFFSSSAKGGLAIAAIGLVPDLTLQLARLAAMSAGGKVVRSYSFSLTAEDVAELEAARPDMILFSGGTDGGNTAYIYENAARLAASKIEAPIIFAGNRAAAGRVGEILKGKDLTVTANLMPEIGRMNLEPAREKIRDLFLERIVAGRGLAGIVRDFGCQPKPTPLAVYELVEALPPVRPEWDDLAVIDMGGATTDFYSNTESYLETDTVVLKGLREPRVKRTVEGDLGLRVSARTLFDSGREFILEELAREGLTESDMATFVAKVSTDTGYLPGALGPVDRVIARSGSPEPRRSNLGRLAIDSEVALSPLKREAPRNGSERGNEVASSPLEREAPRNDVRDDDKREVAREVEREAALDRILAKACVFYAALRHIGGWREAYTPQGKVFVQTGKDLRRVKAVVGSGGYLSRLSSDAVLRRPFSRLVGWGEERKLVPEAPVFYADADYLFPLAGNLAADFPEEAAALAVSSLKRLPPER